MPYSAARPCCSSILTFPILTRPSYSSDNSSRIGPIALQGPHHSAQKSTSTGVRDWTTSAAKLSCVNTTIFGEAITSSGSRLEHESQVSSRSGGGKHSNQCRNRQNLI